MRRTVRLGSLGACLMVAVLGGCRGIAPPCNRQAETMEVVELLLEFHEVDAATIAACHVRFGTDDPSARVALLAAAARFLTAAMTKERPPRQNPALATLTRDLLAVVSNRVATCDILANRTRVTGRTPLVVWEPSPDDVRFFRHAHRLLPQTRRHPPAATKTAPLRPCEDDEKRIARLEDVMRSGYSPDLAMAWREWRATKQACHHGMSNFSEIPNDLYNARRRELANVIRRHLAGNPDDPAAWNQLRSLAWSRNITCGGECGNSALYEWGVTCRPALIGARYTGKDRPPAGNRVRRP